MSPFCSKACPAKFVDSLISERNDLLLWQISFIFKRRKQRNICVGSPVKALQTVRICRIQPDCFIHCFDSTGKTSSFCKFSKNFKDSSTFLTFAVIHVYLHSLRHHVINATVTQRAWFPGNICKIWQPVHSFMLITVKTLVADNLVHVCIHDDHSR